MNNILYTLLVISCLGTSLLRGGKNETIIKVQGEVCGDYWIDNNRYDSFSIREEIKNLIRWGCSVKSGSDDILDIWETDTALYCE
jgi:hypothetical protein